MNVITRLEYELAYYDSAVHRLNNYTTRTPPFGFELKKFSSNVFIWSSAKSFLLFRTFCWELKRWKSLGARSGEYGGWGRTDQLESNIFFNVILAECGNTLKWRSTTFLLLMSARCFLGFSRIPLCFKSTSLHWVTVPGINNFKKLNWIKIIIKICRNSQRPLT